MFGIGSLISGGATGIIGSLVSNFTDLWEQRQKNEHELAMRDRDLKEMDKEITHKEKIAKYKHETEEMKASYDAQEKSYEHDSRQYSSGLEIEKWWLKTLLVLGDFIRASVRPALTAFLIYIVYDTRQEVEMIIDHAGMNKLSPQEAITIYGSIVEMILYLSSTAVTWWFGSRPRSKKKEQTS